MMMMRSISQEVKTHLPDFHSVLNVSKLTDSVFLHTLSLNEKEFEFGVTFDLFFSRIKILRFKISGQRVFNLTHKTKVVL
jgi:hypothetical protein